MRTLGFLGVAHIHTPFFIAQINERPQAFRVKAVWDSRPERAAIAAGHSHSEAVVDYRAILEDEEIDAVVITSETVLHRPLVEGAAAAGKDMFVEKPLAVDAADAFVMRRAIESAGVIFQIGHFMRGHSAYRQIKRFVEDGVFGVITRIRHVNVHHGAIEGWFDPGVGWYADGWSWMTDLEKAGMGGFGDLGAHSLDMLMWLMGDVEAVTAQTGSLLGRYACDEYGEAMLRFANGAIGTIAAGWADLLRGRPILVSGTEGITYIDDGKLYVKSNNLAGADGGEWTDVPEALPHAFVLFLDALVGEDAPLISAREAADRTAVMQAFYQAAASNRWVEPARSR